MNNTTKKVRYLTFLATAFLMLFSLTAIGFAGEYEEPGASDFVSLNQSLIAEINEEYGWTLSVVDEESFYNFYKNCTQEEIRADIIKKYSMQSDDTNNTFESAFEHQNTGARYVARNAVQTALIGYDTYFVLYSLIHGYGNPPVDFVYNSIDDFGCRWYNPTGDRISIDVSAMSYTLDPSGKSCDVTGSGCIIYANGMSDLVWRTYTVTFFAE